MTTVNSFVNRLNKIGIKVELIGNFPWIYLNTVNDKKVEGNFRANHGFTVFFLPIKPGQKEKITDIKIVFDKIRETLNSKPKVMKPLEIAPEYFTALIKILSSYEDMMSDDNDDEEENQDTLALCELLLDRIIQLS